MKRLASLILLALIIFQAAHASPVTDGLNAYYQKEWSEAASNFKQGIREDPKDSLALVYYIVSTFWLGTSEHELRDLEDALIDNPNDQLTQVKLGFFYYTKALVRDQKPDRALTEFRDAARLGPSAIVHTGLGIAYFDVGNFTRAKKEFARSMDMNSKDVLAYEYMGRILLSIDNDPEGALAYFQQELKLVPQYPDGHYYCASALDALGKSDEAIAEYQKTVSLDSLGVGRGTDAKIGLGDIYLQNKQFQDARQAFQDALKLDPNNPVIKERISQVDKAEKAKK